MKIRVNEMIRLRDELNGRDASVVVPNPADNGDEARYADKRGTYTKGLLHQPSGPNMGLVNLSSYSTFKTALLSQQAGDFERITIGNPASRLNGPQGGIAYCLSGLDSSQFSVSPAPALASKEYAVEMIELYWASLLWTVPFATYTPATVGAAVTELNAHLPFYKGPLGVGNVVTPQVLFRGPFVGETNGPYVSQLLLMPADFGALRVNQVYSTLPPKGAGQPPMQYMTAPATYLAAQDGVVPPFPAAGPMSAIQKGAGLAAYTHSDVLYQAHLIAHQALATSGHPGNPGNPYALYVKQKAFATLGGPDAAALIGYVAGEALKAVWWQKWFVHLRHRPEAGGLLVHLQKTAAFDPTTPDPIVAASTAVAQSATANGGSFFLPQAFPEGSPTHPAYPTGHGTVAGACITVLKFLWDGNANVPLPAAPNLPLNGELHKLASNISFGHGIFAGIHWRSDTVESIKLGEKVALAILQDRVQTYNEPLSVTIKLLDGTPYTITNT